jgi:hypothetical protein
LLCSRCLSSLILAEHHIDFVYHGVALISALALAKVMLSARELHLADWFGDAPLIYSTLVESFVFTVVLACFKVAEEVVVGRIHGKSFHESIANLAGGTWRGILTLALLLCIMLILFFASLNYGESSAQIGWLASFFGLGVCWICLPPPTDEFMVDHSQLPLQGAAEFSVIACERYDFVRRGAPRDCSNRRFEAPKRVRQPDPASRMPKPTNSFASRRAPRLSG